MFWATVGGNGLTGIILRATIEMTPTETAYFIADGDVTHSRSTRPSSSTATAVEEPPTAPIRRPGSIAIRKPLEARPRRDLARFTGNAGPAAPKLQKDPLKFDAPQLLTLPDVFPAGLANKLTFMPIGELWYLKSGTYRNKVRT